MGIINGQNLWNVLIYKIPFEESQLHGSYYDVLIMFRIFFKMMKNQTANSRIWDFLVKE